MILMPIIMLSPFAALLLFYFLPLWTALPIYIAILAVGIYYNAVMFWAMHAPPRTGLEAMVGEYAFVKADLDPEGTVEIRGELWSAAARNAKIAAGREVKILKAQGMVLIVEEVEDTGKCASRPDSAAKIESCPSTRHGAIR